MGRLKTEAIKISPELLHLMHDTVTLTPDILSEYGALIRAQGRQENSVRTCELALRQFYNYLPEEKTIAKETLFGWREHLLAENYAIRTVNSRVSMVNALLESMGCRDFQVIRQLDPKDFEAPELTRREYIRMLQTAKILEDERSYVLTKLFATTGINVSELPLVTAEAVRQGDLKIKKGKATEVIRFPASLQGDLLRYAVKYSHTTGQMFTKKSGDPIGRTQVSAYIQKLAQEAKVPVEKGNIRALRQLYKTTISGIEANFDLLVRQAYERQLETEQLSVGWEQA